jgi:hypothetical protein
LDMTVSRFKFNFRPSWPHSTFCLYRKQKTEVPHFSRNIYRLSARILAYILWQNFWLLGRPGYCCFFTKSQTWESQQKFWKGTNGEDLEMELKVKSVKDNCHVWHLIERVASYF